MARLARQSDGLLKQLAGWTLVLAAGWPVHAGAQTSPDASAWRFRGTLYTYLPSLGGSSSVPADSGGTSLNVDAGAIVDGLEFALMGSLDAHNGRWGAFTDFIYLDFGGAKDRSRDFSIGNIGLPAGTDAHLDWQLQGVAWTVAGQYRLVSDPALTLDALGGVRLLDLKHDLSWNISGNIGPLAPSARAGSASGKLSNWDAVIGVKGRYALGGGGAWSLPFYVDVGTGESDLTWQVAAGVTYAFSWGEMSGLWRYLAYEMKSGQVINDLNFNGPMVGVTFRW